MAGRRRGQQDQVRPHRAQHHVIIRERFRQVKTRAEVGHPLGVEIDGGHEHHPAASGLHGADVRVGNAAGANQNGAVGFG